jgi:hypothetical protein
MPARQQSDVRSRPATAERIAAGFFMEATSSPVGARRTTRVERGVPEHESPSRPAPALRDAL